jgi:hypothetical protein
MAKYSAIAATSNDRRLMRENAAVHSESSDANVELSPADKLQNPISNGRFFCLDPTTLTSQHNFAAIYEAGGNIARARVRG